jgi:predicted transcriptional regulator
MKTEALLRNHYKGHTNGPIKYWKPVHDQIIGLYLSGWEQKAIAEYLDMTQATVSRVISDPKGQAIIEGTQKKLREKMRHNIEDAILELSEKSVRNIAKTVNEDVPVMSKQKVHQDNVGFRLLAILGYDKASSAGAQASSSNQPLLSEEQGERLITAIQKADEAKEVHAIEGEDYTIEDGD